MCHPLPNLLTPKSPTPIPLFFPHISSTIYCSFTFNLSHPFLSIIHSPIHMFSRIIRLLHLFVFINPPTLPINYCNALFDYI
ncbi:unnamed protein product [Meloidogyne enterolobii]|uniref:Uncharacterized protein n=1 Tax=Meloidogyne enterolobii TaxID=390850 RepID=A0ACB1ALC4_MELEN